MDLLNELKEASKSSISKYAEFLQQYKFDEQSLHLFFEGNEDQSFYMNYITNIFPKNYKIYTYICNGKGNVHKNYERINWIVYEKHRTLFFTDKDFSKVLSQQWHEDENIFVTSAYSIENYICESYMIERVLREIFHINDTDLINKFCKHFVKTQTYFEHLILPLTALIIMLKRSGNNVHLQDFDLSSIFKFNNDLEIERLKKVKTLDYFSKITSCIIPPNSWKTVLGICKELKRDFKREDYIRGKFSLWFLVSLTKKLPDTINNHKKAGKSKIKCSVCTNINTQNGVEILGPRVTIPDELSLFLKKNAQRLTTAHT